MRWRFVIAAEKKRTNVKRKIKIICGASKMKHTQQSSHSINPNINLFASLLSLPRHREETRRQKRLTRKKLNLFFFFGGKFMGRVKKRQMYEMKFHDCRIEDGKWLPLILPNNQMYYLSKKRWNSEELEDEILRTPLLVLRFHLFIPIRHPIEIHQGGRSVSLKLERWKEILSFELV